MRKRRWRFNVRRVRVLNNQEEEEEEEILLSVECWFPITPLPI